MDVVAAASRCPLMGTSAFRVFDRYFAMFFCIRISFSIALTVLSPEPFYLIDVIVFGVESRERCVFPLKFFLRSEASLEHKWLSWNGLLFPVGLFLLEDSIPSS